ncbi:MAG: hypothetical protein ACPLW7_06830 [Minisyncoccia bacterium]
MEKYIKKTKVMKNIILFYFNFFLISIGYTQNGIEKINDDFSKFLKLFYEVKIPFNYKKELYKIDIGNLKLNEIPKNEAIYYLGFKENELYKNTIIYNYDTDEKKVINELNLPIAHLKYAYNGFYALIYRENKGLYNDSCLVNLAIFNKEGSLIDRMVIGEQFTRENDWMSSIFIAENYFKVFKYEVNWSNVVIDGKIYKIIDEKSPKTTVTVEEYEISINGKIQKKKEFLKKYLMNDISDYKKYNPGNDDIMNN